MKNPMLPESSGVVNIPRAAMTLQFCVNEEYERTELDVLGVSSLFCDVARGIETRHR